MVLSVTYNGFVSGEGCEKPKQVKPGNQQPAVLVMAGCFPKTGKQMASRNINKHLD